MPSERDYLQVPDLPILGSGKVDLFRLKEMAVLSSQQSAVSGQPSTAADR